MSQVSARDANRFFSRLLAEVEAGGTVTVTKRGAPVARISPVGAATAKRARKWTREETDKRRLLVETGRAMNAMGINQGRSGNVSARLSDGLLITPSALAYEDMGPEDVVRFDADGVAAKGGREPSTEWPFHWAILAARPEVEAIVHTHSVHATALACTGKGIPAFHYMVAVAGGKDIRCARYATFGSDKLAASAVRALKGRWACLLANHGQIALGTDVADALERARDVETLAEQYLLALRAGKPRILDDAEMRRVVEKFKTYGRNKT